MKSTVLSAYDITLKRTDGSIVFSSLTFDIPQGIHALICQDERVSSLFCRVLAGEIEPTRGHFGKEQKPLYFPCIEAIPKEATISDELGFGAEVRAARKVQQGSVDPETLALHAESWDAEERALRILGIAGFAETDLLSPLSSLPPDSLLALRMAMAMSHHVSLIIWDQPLKNVSETTKVKFFEFVHDYQETLFLNTMSSDLLRQVENIWKLSANEIRRYEGNLDTYLAIEKTELEAAHTRMLQAQEEVDRTLAAADEARARMQIRRDRSLNADMGISKKHRGNMKRKSQESIGRANSNFTQKIEKAEEALRHARDHEERLLSAMITGEKLDQ